MRVKIASGLFQHFRRKLSSPGEEDEGEAGGTVDIDPVKPYNMASGEREKISSRITRQVRREGQYCTHTHYITCLS